MGMTGNKIFERQRENGPGLMNPDAKNWAVGLLVFVD